MFLIGFANILSMHQESPPTRRDGIRVSMMDLVYVQAIKRILAMFSSIEKMWHPKGFADYLEKQVYETLHI